MKRHSVTRAKRASELRANAAACEAAGFSVFAAINNEEAALLDPPREVHRSTRQGGVE